LRTNYITSLAADGGEIKFLSSIVAPLLFLTETLFLLLGSHIIDKWTTLEVFEKMADSYRIKKNINFA
ncbi:MAG: hypothetical protein IJ368_03090, partial [Oscillospiraceae bacterium]|nr:hypothetical protein [Oscillospiraceae bacterium]